MSQESRGALWAPRTGQDALSRGKLESESQHALAEQVRSACAAWFSQAALVQRHEAEFGLRLAQCRTTAEAAAVCGEWLGHRLDSAVAMHHQLLEIWMTFATLEPPGVDDAARHQASRTGGSSP